MGNPAAMENLLFGVLCGRECPVLSHLPGGSRAAAGHGLVLLCREAGQGWQQRSLHQTLFSLPCAVPPCSEPGSASSGLCVQ